MTSARFSRRVAEPPSRKSNRTSRQLEFGCRSSATPLGRGHSLAKAISKSHVSRLINDGPAVVGLARDAQVFQALGQVDEEGRSLIVGQSAKPPFIRRITERDLNLALDQCLAYADRGDVQLVRPDGEPLVLMSIERWDQLNAANRPGPKF